MPAYDFKCCDCDTVFEVTRSIGDTSDVPCPECEGESKRVFSPVGVVFKGSGFHSTDYRSSSGEAAPAEPCKKKDESSSACASCPAAKDD